MASRANDSSQFTSNDLSASASGSFDKRHSLQRPAMQKPRKLSTIKRSSAPKDTGARRKGRAQQRPDRLAWRSTAGKQAGLRTNVSCNGNKPKAKSVHNKKSPFKSSTSRTNYQIGLGSKSDSFQNGRTTSAGPKRVRRDTRSKGPANGMNLLPKLIITLVALLIIGVVAYFSLRISGAFVIQNVNIEGAKYTTSSELTKSSSIPVGSTLLDLNAGQVESNLETNPWVKDAKVELQFPDTLNLVISEKEMAARVIVMDAEGGTHDWILGDDLMWLTELPGPSSPPNLSVSKGIYDDIESVLLIEDVPIGVAPVTGSYCTDETILNALEIVNGLTTQLANQVVSVKAAYASDAIVMLDSGVEVCFGTPKGTEDIREKERVVLKLLQEHPDEIAYINVAIPSNPTWRSV